MAVVVDDVDRAGVYARSSQGRRVQPAATNRHSHISTRRWCVGGLAVNAKPIGQWLICCLGNGSARAPTKDVPSCEMRRVGARNL